jgi:hypothetical protein
VKGRRAAAGGRRKSFGGKASAGVTFKTRRPPKLFTADYRLLIIVYRLPSFIVISAA